jgi:hypothetical protein
MRDKVIKLKLMNKNIQHIGLKTSSVETRTAHSRDRCRAFGMIKGHSLQS